MYYIAFPEIAGGLGPESIIDNSVFPPNVLILNYQFDGWLGDDLLESFPCFIVTERLRKRLEGSGLEGFAFSDVIVTKSQTFEQLFPYRELPNFYWLQVNGKIYQDDIALTRKGELIISSRMKSLLSDFNISQAVLKEYD